MVEKPGSPKITAHFLDLPKKWIWFWLFGFSTGISGFSLYVKGE